MYEIQKNLKQMGYRQDLSQVHVNVKEFFTLDDFISKLYMRLCLATEHTMGVLDRSVFEWLRNHGEDYWEDDEEGFLYDLAEYAEQIDKYFEYVDLEERYVFIPIYNFYMTEQLDIVSKNLKEA